MPVNAKAPVTTMMIAAADVFVFPSLTDTFGVVQLEALACGTPVLAYRRGSIPEIIEDGVTGFICDNLDEMVAAIEAKVMPLLRERDYGARLFHAPVEGDAELVPGAADVDGCGDAVDVFGEVDHLRGQRLGAGLGLGHGLNSPIERSEAGPLRELDRRARAAAQNIVPNSTGAAKAIGLVLPSLKGKLDGTAQRVPTLTGSLTELTVVLGKKVTVEEINAAMKEAANESYGYTEDEIVSSDIVGMAYGSLFDATQTKVQTVGDAQMVRTVSWYDNEMSYVSQLVRTVKYFAEQIQK